MGQPTLTQQGLYNSDVFLGIADKDSRWRYILITGGLIGGLQAILLYFLPESPMSLVAAGKFQQARKVLVRLRGTSDVEEELAMYIGAPVVCMFLPDPVSSFLVSVLKTRTCCSPRGRSLEGRGNPPSAGPRAGGSRALGLHNPARVPPRPYRCYWCHVGSTTTW